MSNASNAKRRKNDRKIVALTAAAVFVICFIASILFILGRTPDDENISKVTGDPVAEQNEENQIYNPLTGEPGFSPSAVGKRPIAFMVNNAPGARPQWGLCTPDIVIEGLVEGSASRMMWLYADPETVPEKIGSMRSARHDFLEIAQGLDAIFVHWGGSTYAYDALKTSGYDHLDGIYLGPNYTHRDNTRNVAIEHRGYMIGSEIRELIESKGFRTQVKSEAADPFEFSKNGDRTLSGGDCLQVTTSFSSYYSHTFKYDSQTDLYTNYMGETPMTQDGGEVMKVKNVVILYTPVTSLGDSLGRIDMDLTGGTGIYISGGKYETIRWEKGSDEYASLKLYSENGDELVLNAGKSWIGLIPKARENRTVVASNTSDMV